MRSVRTFRILGAAILLIGLGATVEAGAGPPVAIVEDVAAPSTKLRTFDYLSEGMKFQLGATETLTIGYFESCSIEKITGALVTVGKRQSVVTGGGRITRRFVQCGGSKLVLSAREAAQSAVVVTRAGRAGKETPELVVHSAYPLFIFPKSVTTLTIERLDRGGKQRREFNVGARRFDFATIDEALAQGGIYRASIEGRDVVLKISDIARRDRRNVIGRLVGF